MRSERRQSKKLIESETLGSYDLAILRNLPATDGAIALKSRALSESVLKVLNCQIETADGECITVSDKLAISVVTRAIESGSSSDLKNIAQIVGDLGPQKVEFVGSIVDAELRAAALGDLEDGQE